MKTPPTDSELESWGPCPDVFVSLVDRVRHRIGRDDSAPLNRVESLLVTLFDFYNDVCNGGFEKWLLDSKNDAARLTPHYLEEIGAAKTAQLVRRALAEFGEPGLAVDYWERSDQLDALPESAIRVFQGCDREFEDLVDAMTQQLYIYAHAHIKDVRTS